MKAIELLEWLQENLSEEELNSYDVSLFDNNAGIRIPTTDVDDIKKNDYLEDILITCSSW